MTETIFIDTSAFYALIDRTDKYYTEASALWPSLINSGGQMFTTNYVAMETQRLIQTRINTEAARVWYRDILGVSDVIWINRNMHKLAYEIWLNLGYQGVSLVDSTSFIAMRNNGLETVFTFKSSFMTQGFDAIPE